MKILLTGATGYIGKRLLPELIEQKHDITCIVRDADRFHAAAATDSITTIEADFLKETPQLGQEFDVAFYLIHSMSASSEFADLELTAAKSFRKAIEMSGVKQVIYLSGMANEDELSLHLASRLAVEEELKSDAYALTTLRAGIIIGSGSASFEIIRDLVDKLPIMVTPRWLQTRCQPIGIKDVLKMMHRSMLNPDVYDQHFDVGGPDVLTYKEMLLGYARAMGLRRIIITIPIMTPRLSSYWLYFITSTSYKLAVALVDSMKVEVVCKDQRINQLLNVNPATYEQAVLNTISAIERSKIPSSWKDSLASGRFQQRLSEYQSVPTEDVLVDHRSVEIDDPDRVINKIWMIGGRTGWYFATTLWKIRGLLDKMVGGVGLRRGRTHPTHILPGDAIDFWRVLIASKEDRKMLLFAEMRLPGKAWLEFRVTEKQLQQRATFKPNGWWGRMYWYGIYPLHVIVFRGMIKRIAA